MNTEVAGTAGKPYNSPMNVPSQIPYNPTFDATTGVTTNDIIWNFFQAHAKP